MELYSIRHQLYIAGCLYLGQIAMGYTAGWSAPVIPKLQDPSQTPLPDLITKQEASWIGSLTFVGTIFGPYVSGFLSNAKGRKPCMYLGVSLSMISYIILALASNLAMIYTSRIILGFGSGIIFVITLVYIGEIASTHIRGILLTCTGLFTAFGTLLCYVVGPYVPYSIIAYIGLAIHVSFFVDLFFIPESPLFSIIKGQKEQAKVTLKLLGRDKELEQIVLDKLYFTKEKNTKDQWTEIFTVRSNKRALFITLTLCTLQQMSGVIAVLFFATTIFELARSSIQPDLATILIGITQIIASALAPLFVERTGRKLLLILSTAVCCLSLSVLGTYFYLEHIGNDSVTSFGWLPLVTLIIFYFSYDSGFGIIPGTFIGEMFTPTVRSSGSTVSLTIGWLFGFFISSTFGLMIANGAHIAFWIYASACVIALIFSIIFVPETKGKSLLEIQDMLQGPWIK